MSRIEARTVGEPATAGDGTTVAHVELTYALGTSGATTTLRVAQDAAASGGWRVLDPLTATTRVYAQDVAIADIGGADVPIGDPAVSASSVAPWTDVVTYPGTYRIVAADTPYVTFDERTFTAVAGTIATPGQTGATVILASATTPELLAAIDVAVVAAIDACIAGAPMEGIACFRSTGEPTTVVWRSDPVTLTASGGAVRTSTGGIQYPRADGSIRSTSIAFDGTYAFDDEGGVVLRGRVT